jgi:hypothetical protein
MREVQDRARALVGHEADGGVRGVALRVEHDDRTPVAA